MNIDIPTILVVLAMICGLVGAVFLFTWVKRDRTGLSLRAGIGGLVAAVGVVLVLLRGVVPDWLSIHLANALIILSFGFGWSAVRCYGGRSAPWLGTVAGAAVWLAASAIPEIRGDLTIRAMLASLILAGYSFTCAFEFWRAGAPAPRLGAQTALAVLLAVHAGFILVRGVNFAFFVKPESLFEAGWVQGLLTIEPALALVAAALLGVGLIRERSEHELRRNAETDGLTGVLNRRAFFARAEAIADRARQDMRPLALILFDLDHFKAINDRHGHLAGDALLQAFTRVIGRTVRAGDLVGRVGGEEFAVLLEGVDHDRASYIAERVRIDFASAPILWEGGVVTTTVSAGVAVGRDVPVLTLFARADEALYEAKRSGRDKVRSSLPLLAAG